jgi:hypothetical protein
MTTISDLPPTFTTETALARDALARSVANDQDAIVSLVSEVAWPPLGDA